MQIKYYKYRASLCERGLVVQSINLNTNTNHSSPNNPNDSDLALVFLENPCTKCIWSALFHSSISHPEKTLRGFCISH